MNNKKLQVQVALGLALLGGIAVTVPVQAGGFAYSDCRCRWLGAWVRWGIAVYKGDPRVRHNNPAAMAFIDQSVAQFTIDYARINIKYKGRAYDLNGNPLEKTPFEPGRVFWYALFPR